MKKENRRLFLLIAVVALVLLSFQFAAAEAPGETHGAVLDNYIRIAMRRNLALQQQEFSLKKSVQALREARGMFLPSVSIEARYSRAGGGRIIEFPVGDLMNPVYQSLNQLLTVHGQAPGFPQTIPNEEIPFLREEEHETKLRVIQPVFQPAIYYNAKIKKDLAGVEEAKLNAFKRQLTADIKTAYYNYLKTLKVKELLDDTRALLKENVRVSQSLFRNHKRTEEVVLRSRAELSQLDQQRVEAEKNIRLAASYFNFLLNRPLDKEIETDGAAGAGGAFPPDVDVKALEQRALRRREEFRQLYGAVKAAGHAVKLHGSSILPTVTGVFDYGFQGERYRFKGGDDYWMASLVLNWNLFRGGQDRAKKRQAALEKKRLDAQRLELENRVRLQVKEAYHNLLVARSAVVSAADREKSRKEAFRIVSKKYEQGMAPQIEYIKAQNDYTHAAVIHIVARFDRLIKEALLERAAAKY
jgi:outer membrane protein TolC